jgi:hypothetical protein
LASYKVSGDNLTFTGYIILSYGGKSISVGGIREFERDTKNGIYYLLFKSGETFYHGQVKEADLSGKNNPKIKIYKLAYLDKKNAVFAKQSGFENDNKKYLKNLETWVSQGFTYSSRLKTVFIPYFAPTSGNVNLSSVLLYDVSKVFTSKVMKEKKDNSAIPVVFPLGTSYLLKASDKSYEGLEIESCGFRSGQGTKGDLKMYCNANVFLKNGSKGVGDGIFTFKAMNSLNKTSVFNVSKKYYTVKYLGNGGENKGKNSSTGSGKGYFNMNDATRHVYGISSNLRPNYFVKKGKTFKGWSLYRNHDKRTLYRVNKNKVIWCTVAERSKNAECKKATLALYDDRQSVMMLSPYHNDVVEATAMWK